MLFEDKIREKIKQKPNLTVSSQKCDWWMLPDVLIGDYSVKDVFIKTTDFYYDIDIVVINTLFHFYFYLNDFVNKCKSFQSAFEYVKNSIIYCKTVEKDQLIELPDGRIIQLNKEITFQNSLDRSIGAKFDILYKEFKKKRNSNI